MSTETNTWDGPDMGGAYWLCGEKHEAVVVLDPTGETDNYLWSVNELEDHYRDYPLGTGSSTTMEMAMGLAQSVFSLVEG